MKVTSVITYVNAYWKLWIHAYLHAIGSEDRSSHSQMFLKIGILKDTCTESLFRKVAGLQATLLKETPTKVFPCEICKIYKNNFFTEHFHWLLIWRESFLKKEIFPKHGWIKKGPTFSRCSLSFLLSPFFQ